MKYLKLIIVSVLILALTACSNTGTTTKATELTTVAEETSSTSEETTVAEETSSEQNSDNNVVVVYSTRHYESDDELYKRFTAETGIEVKVVKAKANELIQKIESEGEDTEGDLFYTADAGRLEIAKEKGLLKPIDSEVVMANVPEKFRDADKEWIGITKRARVIVYSKDRVNPEELSTYEDLADPKWKGKLLVRSGTNQYNISLVASFLDDKIMGEAKTKEWLKGIVANLAKEPSGGDRDQVKAIYAGQGDLAIVNTYYIGHMLNDVKDPETKKAGESVGVFFPNQETTGTHVNVSGAGLLKNAKHTDAAIKFLEFLTSESAQEQFSSNNYEFPINPKVEVQNELLKSWGTFKEQDFNLSKLGENAAKATELIEEAGWK